MWHHYPSRLSHLCRFRQDHRPSCITGVHLPVHQTCRYNNPISISYFTGWPSCHHLFYPISVYHYSFLQRHHAHLLLIDIISFPSCRSNLYVCTSLLYWWMIGRVLIYHQLEFFGGVILFSIRAHILLLCTPLPVVFLFHLPQAHKVSLLTISLQGCRTINTCSLSLQNHPSCLVWKTLSFWLQND